MSISLSAELCYEEWKRCIQGSGPSFNRLPPQLKWAWERIALIANVSAHAGKNLPLALANSRRGHPYAARWENDSDIGRDIRVAWPTGEHGNWSILDLYPDGMVAIITTDESPCEIFPHPYIYKADLYD
jgi:hypothetical protein